jgi:hypothetical protein
MEQAEIFSRRVRWLAVSAGVSSFVALFPIFFLLYPVLLVLGGIIQPRFPLTGRWFVWAGAAELCVVLITYDVSVLFPHPWSQPPYMTLAFSVSTVLILWCSGELVADALGRLHARYSMPRVEPKPVPWGAWIVAAALNFTLGWSGFGLISSYRQPRDTRLRTTGAYTVCMLLVTAAIVIAFDISLARRVFGRNYVRKRDLDGTSE